MKSTPARSTPTRIARVRSAQRSEAPLSTPNSNSAIYGADKNQTLWRKYTQDLDRVQVMVGNQNDRQFLKGPGSGAGPYDVIIDDCGHQPEAQLDCFKTMWPALKSGGYYIIEDCYRSYKPDFTGTRVPAAVADMVASIYRNFGVLSIQLHYNLCIVQKGIDP